MQQFVFAYHGGSTNMTQEEGKAHMGQWMAWMENLGEAVVDRGVAVGSSKTAGPEGIIQDGGANPLSGYTIVQAIDMDAALKMALESPHIAIGGSIEVAPVMNMSM